MEGYNLAYMLKYAITTESAESGAKERYYNQKKYTTSKQVNGKTVYGDYMTRRYTFVTGYFKTYKYVKWNT